MSLLSTNISAELPPICAKTSDPDSIPAVPVALRVPLIEKFCIAALKPLSLICFFTARL